ncbi:MAG: response regulator [Burkholderiales bacterium]|nr:response regulator [Burkholderiales bacterium]
MPPAPLSRPYRSVVLILAASYALLVIAVGFAGRRMIDEIRDVESQAKDLYEHPFRANAACHEARLAASLIRSELLFVQMERVPTGLHLQLNVEELDHQFEANLDLVEQFYLGDLQQVRETRTLAGRWRERRIALMRLLDAGQYEDARLLTLAEIAPLHDAVMRRLDAISDFTAQKGAFFAEEARRKAADSVQRMWSLLALLVVGALMGAFGVTLVVVGQLKRRDRELARERERIRLLADNVPGLATVLLDAQGRIESWNEGARRLHGYEAAEIIGQSVDRLYTAEQRAAGKTAHLLALALANGFHEDFDWRVRKDGSRLYADVIVCPLRDEAGALRGYIKITRDISERHRLEQDLIAARDHAEAANRAKSGFLANMSHEVRTPLNAIIGLTQLVLDSPLNTEQRDFLGKVQRSSRALLGVLNDLLDYSKIEAGHLEFEVIDMSVEEVLRQSADLFMASIEHKGLDIVVEVDPALPQRVRGDPLRLGQVLNNLVGNAVKFTDHGEIRLAVDLVEPQPADGSVELSFTVADTGIGIAQASVDHLFRAFAQADESVTRRFGGTGLGLAICRHLVSLMGGRISVDSQPGQGSRFIFNARFEAAPQNGAAEADKGLPEHLRVLVVDDHDSSRQLLQRHLDAWQCDVTCVDNADAGLAELRAAHLRPFDLVLIDWLMPGTDGLTMARAIDAEVADGRVDHAPRVIMVTAHAREKLMSAAGTTRVDAVLIKPVVRSTLLDAVNRALAVRPGGGIQPGAAAAPQPEPDDRPAPPSNAWRLAAADIAGKHILLVEDNELSQAVAREFMQRAGLRVSCAGNGGEAMLAVEHERFDAVLMDLHMPDMDGFEATRRIRALPGNQALPIIALTAAALQQDRASAQAAGMNAHLAKPIDPETLIELLIQWLVPREPRSALPGSTDTPATPASAPAPRAADPARMAPIAGKVRLDRAGALARMGGDAKVLARLLKRFGESHVDTARLVGEALDAGDNNAAIELLHRLAGAAASLGLSDLGRVASRFEVKLRAPAEARAVDLPIDTSAAPGDDAAELRRQLTDHIELAQGLIAAELQDHPARQTRLVLRANGELQDAADAAAAALARHDVTRQADAALATADLALGNGAVVGAPAPDRSGGAVRPGATTVPVPVPVAAQPLSPSAPRHDLSSGQGAQAQAGHDSDVMQPNPVGRRHSAARRLVGTLEALQPLLRERDLVPRELLEGLEMHTEAWAITLDPRAQAGLPGSVADAAEVIDALGQLAEQLDAYDYPQAEQALHRALGHMRKLHV